jgi:hypothetical protein
LSDGSSRISTEQKKASRSTCESAGSSTPKESTELKVSKGLSVRDTDVSSGAGCSGGHDIGHGAVIVGEL